MKNIGYTILRIFWIWSLDILGWTNSTKKKVPKKSILENILHCITIRHMNRGYYF